MQTALNFIGIEIGGTKLQLAVGNGTAKISKTLRYNADAAGGAESIRRQIEEGLNQLLAAQEIAAIGVGFGGPVDSKKGTIRTSHQVSGWANFNLVQWLNEKTRRPVAVDNDANTAALAEALHGSGKEHDVVFYMTIGSGIGGGLAINKELYHGRTPGEVEVGHLRLNKKGETVEEKCSGWAVDKKIKAAVEQEPNTILAKLANEPNSKPDAKILHQALKEGDAMAQKIIDETTDDLAFALSHVVHLFHPDVIILGGGLSLLKDYLRKPVEEKLSTYVIKALLPPPPVMIASLGENVVPVGAIELAKKAFATRERKTKTV